MAEDTPRCPTCGAPLGAAGEVCPACLFRAGAESETIGASDSTISAIPEQATRLSTPGTPTRTVTPVAVGPTGLPVAIGPYRIISLLGEGGMGVVYLAEQTEPIRRTVALKVIKLGMDTRDVVARFESERQALALMDHPNIARVIDAGTTPDGRPYFVMEHVAGVPITDYCDAHRLSMRARLALLAQVCGAVQHAHQKGVIHRDLKPSNVLVGELDGTPVPKIIDFGIAKATDQRLTERTMFTEQGQFIGTPEYMSPEQTLGVLDIDATTDIYALGVILYELLAGGLPFEPTTLRRAGYAEMQRIIREDEPPKPSTKVGALGATATDVAGRRQTDAGALRKQLAGDLDWITLKALEKDRARRYASASEFAADIARYLNDEAVLASPPSAAYRARKFVRRHRIGVAAASLVVASLAAGLAVSTSLYFQVRAERDLSDHRSYVGNVAAADAHVRAIERDDARRRLLAAPASLRNWEWGYLWAASMPVAAALPPGDVLAVTSRTLFIARESVLEEWDRETFERTASHALPGQCVAVDRRGRRALVLIRSTDEATSYVVVDVATGRELSHLVLKNYDYHPRFTPDGANILTQRAGITWWDAESGRAIAKRSAADQATVLGLAANGQQVLLGTKSTISLWSPTSGREVVVVSLGAGVDVTSAAISADGRRIIAAGSDDLLKEWDVDTHAVVRTYGKVLNLENVVVSADGRWVAALAWQTIGVWNRATGVKVAELRDGSDLDLHDPQFSDDGEQLYATGRYRDVRVWNIRNAWLSFGLRLSDTTRVAASVDGRHLMALRKSGTVERWDLDALVAEPVPTGSHVLTWTLAISNDGQRLAGGTTDGALVVWTETSSPPVVLGRGAGQIVSLAFSRDGTRIAAVWDESDQGVSREAHGPRRLRVWSIRPATQLIDVEVDPRHDVTFDASGLRVLIAGAAGQTLERKRHDGMAAFFGPTCNTNNADTLQVWDLDSGQKSIGIRQECAYAAAFTPDGASIISDSWETPVIVRSARNGGTILRSEGMPPILQIAVSPDGSRIAVGSGESQIIVLDSRTLESLLVIRLETQDISTLVFSADGSRLIMTSLDGNEALVRVFDARPPHEPTPPRKDLR